jgi:hypothetical protein
MTQGVVFRRGSFLIRTGGLSRRRWDGGELLSPMAGHAKLQEGKGKARIKRSLAAVFRVFTLPSA